MNSELISAIDEAIEGLKEEVTTDQQSTLLGIINTLDGNKYATIEDFTKSPWNKLDDKWDKVTKEIKKTQVDSNTTNVVLKVTGVKKKNEISNEFEPLPENESYVSFDTYSKTAHLTTQDKASAVNGGFFQNKGLAHQVGQWLKKDSVENNPDARYDFSSAKTVTEKIKTEKVKKAKQLDYSTLAEFYFNLYNQNSWKEVPEYWKRIIANDLAENQSIISSAPLIFIEKSKVLKFANKQILEILQDDRISHLIYFVIIQQQAVSVTNLNDDTFKDNFILAAILSGCFVNLEDKESAQLVEQFTRIKQYYSSMQEKIQNIIDGADEDAKAQVLAEHAILVTKADGLFTNPFVEYSMDPGKYDDTKVGAITVEALINYRGVTQKELERILTIIMDPNKQSASNWYLILNDTPYLLQQKNNKLVLSKKELLKFYEKASVKVVFSTERNLYKASDKINFKTIDDTTFILEDPKDNTVKAEDYFEIKNAYLYVKAGKGFITENFTAEVSGAGRDQKVDKIIIKDTIKPLNEKDPGNPNKDKENKDKENKGKENTETQNNTKGNGSKITVKQAKDAIKRYLLDHPTKLLKGKELIDDFIDNNKDPKGNVLNAKYVTLINRSVNDLITNPEDYEYDDKLNKINVTAGTTFSILLDLLNGNVDAAAEQQQKENEDNKSRIPGIQITGRAPKGLTAQQVADKLDILSNILRQDVTNSDNRVAKHAIEQIDAAEIANLVKWFNSRFNPRNQSNVSGDTYGQSDNQQSINRMPRQMPKGKGKR